MSDCTKKLKQIIRSHGLNNTSTRVLLGYFDRMGYKCLLTDEKKCYLKNKDELMDFDEFNPKDYGKADRGSGRGRMVIIDYDIRLGQLAYINRSADKLIRLQNNYFVLNGENNSIDADTLQWTLAYLLEKKNP